MADARPPLPHDPAEVRAELQRRVLALLPALGITDLPRAGLLTPLNPTRQDRRPGSFVIWTQPEAAGGWADYATGEKGDVFDLIRYLGGLSRWIDAYWWALEWLGWGKGVVRSATQDQAARDRREREKRAAEARRQGELDAKAAKAKALWLTGAPGIGGTAAWTYLTRAREIPMGGLGRQPGVHRFIPSLDHFDQDTGEVTTWPAMVSAMAHQDGSEIRGVHITWLAADGSGKAPVEKPKKMRGDPLGCAIRLWKGEGRLTPGEAAARGHRIPLVITEGIEDGWVAACAQPGYRVWAAGSLSLMAALNWPACASAVVLVADNDWDTPEALAAFDKCAARWKAQAAGRPLKVVRAAAGKDLNDWARGVG